MTNTEALRGIINGLKDEMLNTDEMLKFIDAIEDELADANGRIKELEGDLADAEEKIDKLEEEAGYDNEVFVGLDTVYWSLQHGNLEIRQRIETFFNRLKQHNGAGVELFESH